MKKLLLTLAFLLACGGGGSDSVAAPNVNQPLYVRLVLVDCPTTPRCAKQVDVLNQFARMQAFFAKHLGLTVILSGFDSVTDPEPNKFMTVKEFNTTQYRFYSIKKHLDKLGIIANTKGRESLLIIDKYVDEPTDDFVYVAGLSYVCGVYKKEAWSVVYSASGGESAVGLATAIGSHLAHEYGHYCGAGHTPERNNVKDFMFEGLWSYDTLVNPPQQGVLDDINRCLIRRSYLKTKECNKNRRPKLCLKNAGLRDLEKPFGEIFGKLE